MTNDLNVVAFVLLIKNIYNITVEEERTIYDKSFYLFFFVFLSAYTYNIILYRRYDLLRCIHDVKIVKTFGQNIFHVLVCTST